MQEILPGIWHWATPNPSIGDALVSSYWLDGPGIFIDPLLPAEMDLEWFAERPAPPSDVVLVNRHHYRSSGRLRERFGCQVHVPAAGLHEFADRGPVIAYGPGDSLPGGLVGFEVGALSPDDGGLHLRSAGSIWLADTIVRSMTDPAGAVGWVSDSLMDDPAATKRGLLAAFTRVLDEFEFEHVLLAHGLPLVGNGRAALEQLVADGGRTAPGVF
jgi:hypothetical protein